MRPWPRRLLSPQRVVVAAVMVLAATSPPAAAEQTYLTIVATGPSRMALRLDQPTRLGVGGPEGAMAFDGIAGFVLLPHRAGQPPAGWFTWHVDGDWEDVPIGPANAVLPAGTYTLLTTAHSDGATYRMPWSGSRNRTLRPSQRVEQGWSPAVWNEASGQSLSGTALAPIRTAETFVFAFVAYDVVGTGDDRARVCLDIPMPTYPRGCPGRYRADAVQAPWVEPSPVGAVWRTASFVDLPRRNYGVELEVSATGLLTSPRGWVYTLG